MDFLEDSIVRLKSIVRSAIKYGKTTGLIPNLADLRKLKNTYVQKGLVNEAQEIEFIINFLEREQEVALEQHKKKLDKVHELSHEIPVGMVVSFRREGKTLTGELRGFLADRVLVMVKEGSGNNLHEVNPFDMKL